MKKFFELSSWRTALGNLLPSAHGHQGGSRKAAIGSMLIMAMLFAACGDDESWSPSARANDDSSEETSSSSEKAKSSSSKNEESLSSVKSEFSSSAGEVDCSALLEGETGWSWDVPKECRFNPDIDYGTMTDERDGKVYRTVKIGGQVWMAENLNFDPGQGGSGEDKYDWSWCYDNEPKNCDVVGRYYTWAAAIDSVKLATDAENPLDCGYGKTCGLSGKVQGICPSGWHLPSESEWNTLFTKVGGKDVAGTKLKSQSGWHNNGNGDDAFGFSALPAGFNNYGDYYRGGRGAYFWSSTEYNSDHAYSMGLYCYNEYAFLDFSLKYYGFSVRCVKD